MKLNVYGQDGKKSTTQVELNSKVFEVEPNDHVVWMDVRIIMANRRQGTHATKGRSYVRGGGRKPFRQKGTGRARQGTTRAPHHVGGGRVFGPEPRTYNMKINKKVKALARRSVLSYKVKEEKMVIVEDFKFESPSTKSMNSFLDALKLTDKKVLFCTAENSENIVKSANNLYRLNVRASVGFSTYDVLWADTVVMQKSAVEKVNEVLGK